MFKSLWWRGGVWLTGSAFLSKLLGLWRDRLLFATYGEQSLTDAIFTAFRLPDFFFFLFIGGTISTILIPRLKKLQQNEESEFLQGIFIRTGIGFGFLCLLGIFFSGSLISFLGKGLDESLYPLMVSLSRWLFLSVFLLSLTSVLTAYLQGQERFRFLALGPIIYTLSICLSILYFGSLGVHLIGIGAVIGSGVYLFGALFLCRKIIFPLRWTSLPLESKKNIKQDFFFRILNNSAFQINQTIDIFLAGFLVAGSVSGFTIGTALGSILLTIVGIPLSNTFFPKLSEQESWEDRWKVLKRPLLFIWLICIPASIISILCGRFLLNLIYDLPPKTLELALPVFVWTVASLPMMCSIPLLSRTFYGAGDNKSPLIISSVALLTATIFGIWATFVFFNQTSILGLAWANFIASSLSFLFFIGLLARRIYGSKI